MIAPLTADRLPPMGSGEAAVKIRSLIAAYGLDAPFLRLYEGDGAVLALMDGDAVLWGDSEEARLFLTMDPSVRRVRTDAQSAAALAAAWNTTAQVGPVLTAADGMVISAKPIPFTPREYADVAYAVFGESMPPFDAWYTDVSHRFRHGCCRLLGIKEDGRPVAVAMTTAEDDETWLIGAVATLPDYRGRGFAAALVTTLAAMGQAADKQVLLSPKNEAAERLYRGLGFLPYAEYGQVSR